MVCGPSLSGSSSPEHNVAPEGASRCVVRLAGEGCLFGIHPSSVWDSSSLVVSSNLRTLHPIRLDYAHNLAPINTIRHLPIFISHRRSRLVELVVLSEDLHAPYMRILPVLMVLEHAQLHHKRPQLRLTTHPNAVQVDVNPTPRLFTTPLVELNLNTPPPGNISPPSIYNPQPHNINFKYPPAYKTHQVVHPRPAPKLHPRRRVALIKREVQIHADLDDADQLEEVDSE